MASRCVSASSPSWRRTFPCLEDPRRDDEGPVTRAEFDHSAGRGSPRFSGDRSAFDVCVKQATGRGRGSIGIDVKYHECLGVSGIARIRVIMEESARRDRQQILLVHA